MCIHIYTNIVIAYTGIHKCMNINTDTGTHTHTHTHTYIYIYIYIYSHPQTDLFRSIRTHQCG